MENSPITFHRTKWFILFVEREEEAIREIQVITRRNKVKWLNETPVGDNTDTANISQTRCARKKLHVAYLTVHDLSLGFVSDVYSLSEVTKHLCSYAIIKHCNVSCAVICSLFNHLFVPSFHAHLLSF
jgi:hypothetical protein